MDISNEEGLFGARRKVEALARSPQKVVESRKLPAKIEYFQLLLMCAFPVHVWAIVGLLDVMPAIMLQMSLGRILGVAAYVLVFASLESLVFFGLLALASLILPARAFKLKFVYSGTLFIFCLSIAAVLIHLYHTWEIKSLSYIQWSAIWLVGGSAVFAVLVAWVNRHIRLQTILQSVIDRLAVLSLVYLSLDVLGLFVIVSRNIFPIR